MILNPVLAFKCLDQWLPNWGPRFPFGATKGFGGLLKQLLTLLKLANSTGTFTDFYVLFSTNL